LAEQLTRQAPESKYLAYTYSTLTLGRIKVLHLSIVTGGFENNRGQCRHGGEESM